MSRLRIVTFNIAHGRGLMPISGLASRRQLHARLQKIARLIVRLKPDIVALQEIDENSRWAGSFDHLEYLREHAGFPHAIFGVNNRRTGRVHLNYGNALLSRHPILEWENIAFGQRQLGEKGFLFAEIDLHGRRVPIVNLHLHFASRDHRFRQLLRLTDYLEEKQRQRQVHWHVPPILCGDLNNPSHRPDATASLFDYFSRHGSYTLHPASGVNTYPSPWPRRALDFVFLPPYCIRARCRVIRTLLSDHRPVLVEFSIA
ncbi:MAG TPA: endonuclease/exonuclease/phosphatase family protein [Opitutaceae bacterium]|jgi:endonuclease/exonuclease/phosphatase family metal-dependent hydrolase|nr:endonuclease/exonuclease/phosphatase family protein [Opitutaceae bacterium]